jgi:hypothetical protein
MIAKVSQKLVKLFTIFKGHTEFLESIKVKVHPRTCHKSPDRGVEVGLYSFFKLEPRWGVGGQDHALGRFTPGKEPGTHCT